MKCVVMWLNMCCFIIKRHQIKVWAVKVGFDPRQVAHTVTPRAAYNISFHLKPEWCQLAEWAVNGWIKSAKRAHIWTFPSLPPLRI